MKQEAPTTERKISTPHHSPLPVAHTRVSRTSKDSSRLDIPNGNSLSPGSRANNNSSRVRRPIFSSKPKERESIDNAKILDSQEKTRTVELYARSRRHVDTNRKGSLDDQNHEKAKEDLERKLSASENIVKELRSEVLNLEARLENLKNYNVVLEKQNIQLARDLSSAEVKIKELEKHDQVETMSKEIQSSDFEDVRKLIANKLDLHPVKKEVTKAEKSSKIESLALKPVEIHQKIQSSAPPPPPPAFQIGPPPPPPPPPSRKVSSRVNAMRNETSLVELYHSITKRGGKNGHYMGTEQNCSSPVANNKAHNSIVDELQNRSTHLLAIKADVEKKGNFINHLIQKVQSMVFTDIDDVLSFVDWLDGQLSTLADERAVLKHFNWPERKADALREASFEYRDLKKLLYEVSSFEDDSCLSCESILKKITTLLDKSERSIQRLIRLRDTNMASYKECKIPIEWMFDSGMISKIKLASGKLAKVYIKRVSSELKLAGHAETELKQEALLLQSVHFAYRAYQFGGGLDSETMRAFDELRNRVQLRL